MAELKQKIQEIKVLMAGEGELSQSELIIVTCHAVNLFHGLTCINEKFQACEFPIDWKNHEEGVYKINYMRKVESKKEGVIVRFRFVDIGHGISVNFVEEGTQNLFHLEISSNQKQEEISKIYEKELSSFLKPAKKSQVADPIALRPNPVRPFQYDPPVGQRPRPPMFQPPDNLPFNNPFGRQEYVGPNSGVFMQGGNQTMPNNRIPPGARYDKVDPFDLNQGGRSVNPQDFNGFDEFGMPKRRPGFGGLGGGLGGGGFGGGFGGGSGPNHFI